MKKLSDLYQLPMLDGGDCLMDSGYRYEITFNDSDSNHKDQIKAVSVAINNHEALVDLLERLTPKVEFVTETICGGCYNLTTTKDHEEQCDYIAAINLLNKIKGESNENK